MIAELQWLLLDLVNLDRINETHKTCFLDSHYIKFTHDDMFHHPVASLEVLQFLTLFIQS